MKEIIFRECKECSKKPGSPILCDECLEQRHRIELINRSLEKFEEVYKELAR
jgi:hypothetical protein